MHMRESINLHLISSHKNRSIKFVDPIDFVHKTNGWSN